jgi:hypothetical protein
MRLTLKQACPISYTTRIHFGYDPYDDSLPKAKTAVFFDEGPCYLWIRGLGNGSMSDVQLVRSLGDGQLYIRKRLRKYRPLMVDGEPGEVRFSNLSQIQPHNPLFPELFEWTNHTSPCPEGPSTDAFGSNETYGDPGSVSVIMRFYNGGDMGQMIDWQYYESH